LRYSIGDVSRVMGMTTAALHFYEKEGIIDTPKVESGRRYYEEADINRLISAKKYRAMGVPVRDIALQFSAEGMTGQQVLERIKEKREEASNMQRYYAGLVQDIDQLIEISEEGLAATSKVDIRRTEEMLWFSSSSGGRIPLDKQEQTIARRWLEAMPAVSISLCRPLEGDKTLPSLIVPAARAAEFALNKGERAVRQIPAGMALHAIVVCGEEQYDDPDVIFKPILAFAREHRFVQKETMWGRMIFVDCSNGVRRHYYDTYMIFKN